MRKLMILLACIFCHWQLQAQGYELTFQLKQYTGGQLSLAHYMGKSFYLADSAQINAQGVAVMRNKEALPGGIYIVLLPGRQRYFEMLLDNKDQQFSVSIDTTDLINKTVFKTSKENEIFQSYNKFLSKEIAPQDKALNAMLAKHTAADSAAAKSLQQELGKKLQNFRNGIVGGYPKSLLTSIFRAMKDPEVPTAPAGDSTFAYRYYKSHYWDSVNLSDGRLVRTDIIEKKLSRYFTQLVPMEPDSIIMEADNLIAKTRKDKEMFKFVVWWLTYTAETSKYMGMDAVFVHLVEKYYVSGEAYWLKDDQLNKIISRAYSMAPNLIGQQAPPLEVKDSSMKAVSLYTTKAKYTILVFWDPTCGHCKIEVPKLDSAYNASWKNKGVAMIGFKTEGTKDEWQSFIKEHKLNGWIHAWDPDAQSNYRRLYDVYSTPVVYLLDEKKKILAKRLGVEQLSDFLEKLETKGGTVRK
ncbi:redoxin domain-containing protein [Chitinophaga ginsengisoli]|uniref:Peroxiredoxin n=1 Tax=Chitinophaga ginsengisoli TaxID=363837 RepID=A0A2P8GNV6_9BACT|nr:redoxin domain-containing protein [Chitinophaga ginsengisoli]PSL35652.1 peroxiredoxin [Chitinophaga ginsengisoli]